MTKSTLIEKIRAYLRDTNGKIFEDSELSYMIDRAAEAYSADTGIFRSKFFFRVNSDGVCELPENYLKFLAAWNDNGEKICSIPIGEIARFYPDYYSIKGHPEFVYEDMDRIGCVRFCPNPYDFQNGISYTVPGYGTPVLKHGYGIPDHAINYGIPISLHFFEETGDMVYIRKESAENISDYMALLFHVLYQAYNNDSDFHNADKAAFYRSQYRRRIARFGQMKPGNTSIRKQRNFY